MRFGARGKQEIKNNLIQFKGGGKEKSDVLPIPMEDVKRNGFFYSGFHESSIPTDCSPHIISITTEPLKNV